jgi:hypothetical protein
VYCSFVIEDLADFNTMVTRFPVHHVQSPIITLLGFVVVKKGYEKGNNKLDNNREWLEFSIVWLLTFTSGIRHHVHF